MLKIFKKTLMIVPFFVFGFISIFNLNVDAASIYGSETDTIDGYYFNDDGKVTVLSPSQFAGELFVNYRVIAPVGTNGADNGQRVATSWIKDYHADEDWTQFEFDIDFRMLINNNLFNQPFTDEAQLAPYPSIAESTYYIQIKYYEGLYLGFDILPKHLPQYDTTLRLVRWEESPMIDVSSNKSPYNLSVSTNSILTKVRYFYSNEDLQFSNSIFSANYESATVKNDISSSIQNGDLTTSIDTSAHEDTYKYLYIMAADANGNLNFSSIDLDTGASTNLDDVDDDDPDETVGTGLLPKYSEFILIFLIIVLIVTSALIVTQKIVDHRKRL